jgi:type II secretory pathway pseudopilin PulG
MVRDTRYKVPNARSGQSLVELLIGIGVGTILIGSAAMLVSVTLKASRENKFLQAATFLAQEELERVAVYADARWYCNSGACGIYNLLKGSSNEYHLGTTTPSFTSVLGDEAGIALDGVLYSRSFYVENVCRNSSGGITGVVQGGSCASGFEDPSTQHVTATVAWDPAGSLSISRYLTRHGNRVVVQTDWSGGPGQPGLWALQSKYDVDDGHIEYLSIPGSITMKP